MNENPTDFSGIFYFCTSMNKERTIEIFTELGNRLQSLTAEELTQWKREAEIHNKWFTEDNVQKALEGIIFMLKKENLEKWLKPYTFPVAKPKKVGVIMAGNIPMVGFHDMLSVLIAGHILTAKLSSDDSILLKKIAGLLIDIEPALKDKIVFTESLKEIDAVITTGSDNTAKHFEYYFSKIPRIIRKNRVSVAVLTGEESKEELALLGGDMLQYFGLGCRNVSKIFIPKEMTLNHIYEAIEPWRPVINSQKYGNNYEYNRSVFLLKSMLHLDNGFLIAMETEELVSAIAVFYYEKYSSIEEVKARLQEQAEKIQCVVAKDGVLENSVPFGAAQCPYPWEYADGVDTIEFLIKV
jgi:hypothetical protein